MKAETVFKVISSSGNPYDVRFLISNNMLSIVCSCPAGIHGKLCKHKVGLLEGDSSLLFLRSDCDTLEEIHEIVKRSKYIEMASSYNLLKREIDVLRDKEKKLKEEIEHSLRAGVEIVLI